MKITINNLEVKAEGQTASNIIFSTTTFNESAAKPSAVSSKVLDTESLSVEEKALVEAFVNLIKSK